MRVMVAGCGWLGRAIALRLAEQGARVTAIVRRDESAARLRAEGLEALAIDLAVPGAIGALAGSFDGVVTAHAAAGHDAAAYRRAYVDATRELLSCEAVTGASFVYLSSTGVFGQRDGAWVDETTPPSPGDPLAEILLAAERLVLDESGHAAKSCVVRCSGLYGPGRAGTIERVRSGALAFGHGDETWMNFCHRDDAATTVIAALDRGRSGATYHASDASPATRHDVVGWIASRLAIAPPQKGESAPEAGRRVAHRRVSAEATRRELGVRLAYPSFREGFAELLS